MNLGRLLGVAPWVLSTVLCCLLAGCAPIAAQALGAAFGSVNPFAPMLPPGGRYVSGAPFDMTGIRVRSLHIRQDLGMDSVQLSLSTPRAADDAPSRSLRRALLVPPVAPPCTAGWMAESVWLANQHRWDRPVPLADKLDLAFPLPEEYLRGPLALDLMIEDATGSHCNRILLGAPGEGGLVRETRTSGGGGFGFVLGRPPRADGTTPSFRDSFGMMFMSSLGRWFGHWRLGGRLEACLGSCGGHGFITVPALAVVERMFYRGRFVTVAVSVGYQVGRIDDAIRAFQGNGTWAHGPRASLLLLGPRPFAGANPDEGFEARGFEIFLHRQFFTVGDPTLEPPAWILGLAVVAL